MKKTIFILAGILSLVSLKAQERVNRPKAEFSSQSVKLDSATGWSYNKTEGIWVGNQNIVSKDPYKNYPSLRGTDYHKSNEQTMRNTVLGLKKITRVKDVSSTPNMKENRKWSEPESPYAARYPKNHVRFTESGHVEEFDDTPKSERIHLYHKSGTFTEIGNGYENDPDGTEVKKIIGNGYEICCGNKKVYVSGSDGMDLVVSGKVNLTVGEGVNIEVNGTANILARENMNIKCDGFLKVSGKQMEFFSQENTAFSGKSISFISDSGVMVIGQDGTISMNSGEPSVRPKAVDI